MRGKRGDERESEKMEEGGENEKQKCYVSVRLQNPQSPPANGNNRRVSEYGEDCEYLI